MRPVLGFVAGLVLLAACSANDSSAVQVLTSPISTTATDQSGSFDVIDIDQANHLLYAADRDRGVDVFDASTVPARYVKSIDVTDSPNGLAIAPDLGRLFVGLAGGAVAIVDIKPGSPKVDSVVNTVSTGGKIVDLLDYSPSNQMLFASNGADGTITTVDASTGVVMAHIKVGSAVEQPRFNPADGMLYATSPDADALFKIDPRAGVVKHKAGLGGCNPTGLAINPRSDQALIACGRWVLSMDLRGGQSKTFNEVGGGDVVSYDPTVGEFFVAAPRELPRSVVGIFGGNPIDYVSEVETGSFGNSAAYDETNGVVYTTDVLPGKVGLVGFRPPAGGLDLSAMLPSLVPLGVIAAVLALFMYIVGRGADPILRPAPEPKRRRHI
jgi:WD40 repeat protein